MFALYAYLIVAGGIVLWMYCAEKAGGHLALALCCAAIAVPAFLAGMRER